MKKIKSCIAIMLIVLISSLIITPSQTYAAQTNPLGGMYKVRAKTQYNPMKYLSTNGQEINQSTAMVHRAKIKECIDAARNDSNKFVIAKMFLKTQYCNYIYGAYCFNGDALVYETNGGLSSQVGSGTITLQEVLSNVTTNSAVYLRDYDDNYPASNFKYVQGENASGLLVSSNVKENGAYLIEDSSGAKYYVSYEDIFIESGVTYYDNSVAMTDFALSQTAITAKSGDTVSLTITALPANATNFETCTVNSSNTAVISKVSEPQSIGNNQKTVVLRANSAGTATITVSCNGITKTCNVTVTQSVTGVSITPSTLNIEVGKTSVLTANVMPTNATNKTVTWTTDNSSVATVNSNGMVTGVGKGTTRIIAKTADGNYTSTCAVTVTQPVTSISLNKTSAKLKVGESETLIASVAPTTANNTNVTWSTSNSSVATVTNGRITAIGKGTAIITVTTEDGNKTATCEITVTQPVTNVSLNKTSATLKAGETETLIATVSPTTADNTKVAWNTSNSSVATVSSTGVVTAIGKGTATITVTTEDGNKTAQCTITVEESTSSTVAVTGVSLDKTSGTLKVGNTITLNKTITPSNATNQNVIWSTSNSSVATVSSTGVITAVGKGISTITVTTVDGNKTAVCTVNVIEEGSITTEVTSTKYSVDNANRTITRISLDTKREIFNNNIQVNEEYKIYNRDGVEISETDKIGTGMKLKTSANEYNLVVPSDLNGDGQLSISDLTKIKFHLVSLQKLEGAYEEAADVNGDGNVSISDLAKIKKQLVGLQ